MNYSIIFKMLSLVLGVMAVAFSICAGVSVIYSQVPIEAEAMPAWICVIAFALLLSFAFYLPSRNAPKKLFKKEAMCVVGLGWILASLVGALPYILILNCPFSDAFFEASSGLTTTGSSVFGDFDLIPPSLMFWRCMSHWIGGAGVVVFFVAVLSFLGSGAKIIFSNEASANAGGGLETERIQSWALRILMIYGAISIICLIVFRLCGMGWFDGICHMFSTVSTGGFSVYEDSISHYNSLLIDWAVVLFMTIGGISFMTLIFFARGKFDKVRKDEELWTYLAILATVGTAITLMRMEDFSSLSVWWHTFSSSVFQTVALMTTTGFYTEDYQLWKPGTQVLLMMVVIIGGCGGSTSGGLKVWRAIAAFKICRRDVERSFRPHVVRNLRLSGRNVSDESSTDIITYIVLFAMVILASFVVLAILQPELSFAGCVSAVLSSFSNAGPGLNEVAPVDNYGFMSDAGKIFLSIVMIMGRLEIFAIIVLFMPSLWKKFQ